MRHVLITLVFLALLASPARAATVTAAVDATPGGPHAW
jgi:hypothetical protein